MANLAQKPGQVSTKLTHAHSLGLWRLPVPLRLRHGTHRMWTQSVYTKVGQRQ
jgi:hypothetical protein